MEFRVLGPLEVTDGTRRLALGGPKQRALLALLLLHQGAVSRDRLVEALWQGRPPKTADGTLRAYLSRLRREIGPERLRLEAAGYLLVVDAEEVDARRFERLALAGRRALADGEPRAAADLLVEALELWRGDVVIDVASELPPLAEPARLEELRLAAVEDRIDADLALGQHRRLVGELESLVVASPFRERLRSQLMLSLYHSERQADALAAYGQARMFFREELGLEPGPRLRELQGAILRHEVPTVSAPTQRSHNLPTQLSSFVGRQAELVELEGLVRHHRLVALTGVGGVGKTRLALETATRLLAAFRDGIRLVELAPIGNASALSRAVGDVVGVDARTVSSSDLDPLCARLEHSETLLILDNCEHLTAPTAELVEKVIGRCNRVNVLVTSRQRLGIPGEVVFNVQPFGQSAAVRLFLERDPFSSARGDDSERLAAVARICQKLDGLPLAIELAAARTVIRSPAEIAEHLDDRFRFLESWKRHGPARHQTLRATMDWSYELLTPSAQRLLRRLSVFVDGFTLAAAASVGFDGDEASALDLLGSLADASLATVEETAGVSRYSFLETVRQYAAIRLLEAEEADEAGLCLARFALAIAEAANLSAEAEGLQDHRAVAAEYANIHAALEWASAHDVPLAVRLATALENFWVTRDPRQGAQWFELLLADSESLPADLHARALRAYGSSLHVVGERERALRAYEQSLLLFRGLAEERSIALLLHRVGMVTLEQNDADRAETFLTESLELARRAGSRRGEAQALGSLGSVERARGNTERARQLFEQSESMAADLGRTWWQAGMLSNLAELALESSDYAAAEGHASSSLRLARAMGDRRMSAHSLLCLARIASAVADERRAGRLFGAIEIEEQREAISQWPRSALTPPLSFPLDQAEFNHGRAEGRQLSLAQASDYALRGPGVPDG